MKTAAILLALALGVSCDTLGGHGSHAHGSHRQGRQEEEAALDSYAQPSYGEDLDTAASDAADPLAMLQASIPGVPGEDYPIYAEVPESGFSCEGQVDGGYYADAEGLYGLNDELAAEREAASASEPQGSYASPDAAPIGGYDAPAGVIEDAQAAYGQAARNARNGRGPEVPFNAPSGRRGGRRGNRG